MNTIQASAALVWQPLDTAPRARDVLCRRTGGRAPIVAGLFQGHWFTCDNDTRAIDGIDAWMLLPCDAQRMAASELAAAEPLAHLQATITELADEAHAALPPGAVGAHAAVQMLAAAAVITDRAQIEAIFAEDFEAEGAAGSAP